MVTFNTLLILSTTIGVLMVLGIIWGIWSMNGTMTVACAGSNNAQYPSTIKINRAVLQKVEKFIASLSSSELYHPYVVQGQSMRFAGIKPNDILIAKKFEHDGQQNIFNNIAVIKINDVRKDECHFKIRRSWQIVDINQNVNTFEATVREIMSNPHFIELRERAKDKCPSDQQLLDHISTVFCSRKEEMDSKCDSYLLSSTYKTTEDQIQFSLHRISSVQGIVEYIQRDTTSQ